MSEFVEPKKPNKKKTKVNENKTESKENKPTKKRKREVVEEGSRKKAKLNKNLGKKEDTEEVVPNVINEEDEEEINNFIMQEEKEGEKKGEKKGEKEGEKSSSFSFEEDSSLTESHSSQTSTDLSSTVDEFATQIPEIKIDDYIKDKMSKRIKKLKKKEKDIKLSDPRGVVYLGHLPYGFFEDQLRGFFSQFGVISRLEYQGIKRQERLNIIVL